MRKGWGMLVVNMNVNVREDQKCEKWKLRHNRNGEQSEGCEAE
jgi:hypothetical protein